MSRLTVGSIEGLTENSNVISVPTGHSLDVVDGIQVAGEYMTPYAGRRNLLFNGAMQVAQRGTSTPTSSGGYFTADRWKTENTSLGAWTQSVENDAPTGSGFRQSLKMLCTTADASPAANDYLALRQSLEGQDVQQIKKGTSAAEQLTLSFWVKSNVTGTYVTRLKDEDNARNCSASYTISASATWEKKTIAFPADTTGVLDNDNAASLFVEFLLAGASAYNNAPLQTTWGAEGTAANIAAGQTNLASAVNNYWQITGVQLELGDKATPFEHRPYGEELERCKRYYKRYAANGNAGYRPWAGGIVNAATTHLLTVFHSPYMRAAPAFNFSQLSDFDIEPFDAQPSGLSLYSSGSNTGEYTNIEMTSSASYTQGHYVVLSGDTAGSWIEFDAEL
jgi:hypothetical protein